MGEEIIIEDAQAKLKMLTADHLQQTWDIGLMPL